MLEKTKPVINTEEQFHKMFVDWYKDLWLYAYKITEDEDLAADVVQEVFYQLWEKRNTIHEIKNLKSYLLLAIRNWSYNLLKRENVKRRYLDQVAGERERLFDTGIEEKLIEQETIDKINKAVEALPDKYRTVLVLSRFKGLKNKEIAEILNLPLRTVDSRIYRGLIKLKEELSDYYFLLFNIYGRQLKIKD